MKQLILLALFSIVINEALSQSNILADQANKHIGEVDTVQGNFHHGELRKILPDSAVEFFYLSSAIHTDATFIIIVKIDRSNYVSACKRFEKINKGRGAEDKDFKFFAIGKIFLYEGIPAMVVNYDDLIGLMPID